MYGENPYYTPEKFGLEIVGEVEQSEPCYSFDLLVVWKDGDGKFYVEQDEGCSCPSPFEDLKFDEMKPMTREETLDVLGSFKEGDYGKSQAIDVMARIL